MKKDILIKDQTNVVVRFSGDSGDGMQLSGSIFSNLAAVLGNQIATFPDFPAEMRAPQGTLSGVSGFQIHLGAKVYTAGDKADVLIAMNPAALKVNAKTIKPTSVVIIDQDSFALKDLEKAEFKTDNPFKELGLDSVQVVPIPITSQTRASLEDFDFDLKTKTRSKNMFALGVVCWLFNNPLDVANDILSEKFSSKPTILEANLKVLVDGYNFGHNNDLLISTYRVECVENKPGYYIDVNGNRATAFGLIAAAEKANKPLYLGSYPITPATDILQELVLHKSLGVKVVQAEDEIAAICSSIGASFAGNLAITTTSGPGLALKSEAIGLAVMAELPLVIVDVQRGGPSTGLPTKTEQTDLKQALYGRNGESPVVVIAATSPTDCFDSAYWASKLALEHITPVILLTDSYIANGASAWKIPSPEDYLPVVPHDQTLYKGDDWNVAKRDDQTLARYWAEAGLEGYTHRIGGLEKDYNTGTISTNPENHQKMTNIRQAKIDAIENFIPELEVIGDKDSEILLVGWGGTYGHLLAATHQVREKGHKLAFAHFKFINPLPRNTKELLSSYKKIIVAEQNNGQFAGYLSEKIANLNIIKYNRVNGQPFVVEDLVENFVKILS